MSTHIISCKDRQLGVPRIEVRTGLNRKRRGCSQYWNGFECILARGWGGHRSAHWMVARFALGWTGCSVTYFHTLGEQRKTDSNSWSGLMRLWRSCGASIAGTTRHG